MTEPDPRRPPTDDAIRAMLETRADRLGPASPGVDALVAEAIKWQDDSLSVAGPSRPRVAYRLALATTSLAAVLVFAAIVAIPIANRPPASVVPSGTAGESSPTTAASPGSPAPSARPEISILTPAQVGELARNRAAALNQTIVAVRGRLELDPSVPCARGSICANTLLAESGDGFHLRPVGDIGRGPWDGSGPKSGVFVVRFTADTEGGRPIIYLLGDLTTPGDRLGWTVAELLAGAAHREGAWVAVTGWLVRTPFRPCPSRLTPSSPPGAQLPTRPDLDCPDADDLTDGPYQPLQPDGSTIGTSTSIRLPTGTYATWAPDPAAYGRDSVGVQPRQATWLLQLVDYGCGPLADCAGGTLLWRMAGRFDPIPGVTAPATPPPSVPEVSGGTYPGGIPRSVGGEAVSIGLESRQRIANATDDGSFLVAGWFDWHVSNMCTGGIGPSDPNPLGARGCSDHEIDGVPGRLYFGDLAMPQVDGPIVIRVHTHDPAAETCWNPAACRQMVVVEEVVWSGDSTTVSAPIGPGEAISRLLSVAFADNRPQGDKTIYYVDEDIFTQPIACPAPWPTLLFAVHGEPRLGLLAVFPDGVSRASFQAAVDPSAAGSCLADAFDRPIGPARWIGRDNLLVLAFGDDATIAAIDASFGLPIGDSRKKTIALPGAGLDLSRETLIDYLTARQLGETDHAAGSRLIMLQPDDRIDVYGSWEADSLRRNAANALEGTLTLVSADPTEADLGAELWRKVTSATNLWLYRVDYPSATDSALASETFLVIQDAKSTFKDWQLLRVAGAAYPVVAMPLPVALPPGVSWFPGTGGDGDTPCLPAGHECG